MKEQPYLTFSLSDRSYAISSTTVEEMFPLPEITLLPTSSADIIGVLNLRGDIVPIIDLKLSLGQAPTDYQTTDSIIILKQSQLRVGLIVNSIGALETFSTTELDASDSRRQAQQTASRRKNMISGKIQTAEVVKISTEQPCWILNEPEKWLRYVEIQQLISVASVLEEDPSLLPSPNASGLNDLVEGSTDELHPRSDRFSLNAAPEAIALFKQRAQSLRQSIESDQQETLSTLAIVSIQQAHFGVNLSTIREFTTVQNVTPIPCCPPHIIGNMNLRGDILTLIDIYPFLSPEPSPQSSSETSTDQAMNTASAPLLDSAKAMVIQLDDCVAGILVKDVLEAMFLLRDTMVSEQPSIDEQPYLQGKFQYRESAVGILDLPKLLSEKNVLVDEVV